MKKYLLRFSKITAITIGVILSLLIVITFIITSLYKDNIIRFAIGEINKQLVVPINVKRIDFSIWKTFPNASIEFDDVLVNSAQKGHGAVPVKIQRDTFVQAEQIYLEMNTYKLLCGTYKLNQVTVINGSIKLKVDSLGLTNYDIIKKAKGSKKPGFDLNFDNVLLINTLCDYSNQKLAIRLKGKANRLHIRGEVQETRTWLDIEAKMFINEIEVSGTNYLSDKHVSLISSFSASHNTYQIGPSEISIEGVPFKTSGYLCLSDPSSLALEANGEKLDIAKLTRLLPAKFIQKLDRYSQKGSASVNVSIKGPIGKGKLPAIEVGFIVKNGTFVEKSSGIKLEKVGLKGFYSNNTATGKPDLLKIAKFAAKLGSGSIGGNFSIRQLSDPIVDITISSKLNLCEIKSFFRMDTLEILKGWVESNLTVKGNLHLGQNLKLADLAALNYSGSVKISDGCFKIKNIEYNFNNINGEFTIMNDIVFKDLIFKLHNNDFHVVGTLTNGVPYFLDKGQSAVLTADIRSKNLDLSAYFVSSPANTKDKPTYSRQLLFPDNLTLDVNLDIDNFNLHKFNARGVKCKLFYRPTIFTVKSLSFQSLAGHVSGNGLIVQDMDKNFITRSQLDLANVDIQKMFYTFNNFSQNIVTDKNLRGSLTGTIDISSQWNNALVLDKDKLMLDGDITINNGELVDFEYVKGLSKFISVDELKTIRFKTLKNRITVKDQRVNIPEMDVYSSAFNIKASGVHYFDNHYAYKVKVLLSDILWGKAKKRKKENEEFGVVEDDGLGKTTIPLSITGYNDDYKISYDTKGAINTVRESLDKQKGEMKQIFKDEFGWYKNDTTSKQKKAHASQNFRVSWDDDNPSNGDDTSNNAQPAKKQEDKAKVEWDDE